MERINNYKLRNTANIIQEILMIVMAIAFTTAIIIFLSDGTNAPREFGKITLESIFAFACVITAIVRFFHGNINYMSSTYNVPDYVAIHRKYNIRLMLDFVFLFIQAFIFCCLALYQPMSFEFYSLFAALFFIDAVWFFIIRGFSGVTGYRAPDEPALVNWSVTNFITALCLVLILFVLSEKSHWLFVAIMVNTVIDYKLNWKLLYFPTPEVKKRGTVFVAARFTTALQSDGNFDGELKKKIEAVHEAVTERGMTVISSHIAEKFGEEKSEAVDFVERDVKDISECNLFILLLDEIISGGAFTELGWASLFDKPIIILVPATCDIKGAFPMVEGMHRMAQCEIIRYKNIRELKDNLKEALQRKVSK